MSRKMFVPFHDDGVISQFEGYEKLAELDWDAYREKYGRIQRLDRILRSEGDEPDRYMLAKQADTVMLFYLFSEEELRRLFERLGYEFGPETARKNIAYYDARSSPRWTRRARGIASSRRSRATSETCRAVPPRRVSTSG